MHGRFESWCTWLETLPSEFHRQQNFAFRIVTRTFVPVYSSSATGSLVPWHKETHRDACKQTVARVFTRAGRRDADQHRHRCENLQVPLPPILFFFPLFLHRRREPRHGKIRRLHRRREPGGGQPFIDRTHSVCLWKVDNAAAFSRFVRGNVSFGSAIVRTSRQFPSYTRIAQSFALADGLSRSFPSMRYLGYEFLAVPLVGDVSRVFSSACRRMNFLNRFELDAKKRFSGDLWSECHSTIKKMRFNFMRSKTGRICWKTDK